MANHASAEKRNRQRIVRTIRNRAARSALRTTVRKARAALESLAHPGAHGSHGSHNTASGPQMTVAEARALVQVASVALARAAAKGLVHKNNAARVTSRITAQLHKLGAASA